MKASVGILRCVYISLFPFDDSTSGSIYIILNTQDEKERDRLTEKWQTHKLEELNFVGIVVSLVTE